MGKEEGEMAGRSERAALAFGAWRLLKGSARRGAAAAGWGIGAALAAWGLIGTVALWPMLLRVDSGGAVPEGELRLMWALGFGGLATALWGAWELAAGLLPGRMGPGWASRRFWGSADRKGAGAAGEWEGWEMAALGLGMAGSWLAGALARGLRGARGWARGLPAGAGRLRAACLEAGAPEGAREEGRSIGEAAGPAAGKARRRGL